MSRLPVPLFSILVKAFLARDKVDVNNMEFRLMQAEKSIAERELRDKSMEQQNKQNKCDKIQIKLDKLIEERRAMGRGSRFIRTYEVPGEAEYIRVFETEVRGSVDQLSTVTEVARLAKKFQENPVDLTLDELKKLQGGANGQFATGQVNAFLSTHPDASQVDRSVSEALHSNLNALSADLDRQAE